MTDRPHGKGKSKKTAKAPAAPAPATKSSEPLFDDLTTSHGTFLTDMVSRNNLRRGPAAPQATPPTVLTPPTPLTRPTEAPADNPKASPEPESKPETTAKATKKRRHKKGKKGRPDVPMSREHASVVEEFQRRNELVAATRSAQHNLQPRTLFEAQGPSLIREHDSSGPTASPDEQGGQGVQAPCMEPVQHDPLSTSTLATRMTVQAREERAQRDAMLRETAAHIQDASVPLDASYRPTDIDDLRPAQALAKGEVELQDTRDRPASGDGEPRSEGTAGMGLWIDGFAEAASVPLPEREVPKDTPAPDRMVLLTMNEYRDREHKHLQRLVRIAQHYEEPLQRDQDVEKDDLEMLFGGVDGLLRAAFLVVEQMRVDDSALERVLARVRAEMVGSYVLLMRHTAQRNVLLQRIEAARKPRYETLKRHLGAERGVSDLRGLLATVHAWPGTVTQLLKTLAKLCDASQAHRARAAGYRAQVAVYTEMDARADVAVAQSKTQLLRKYVERAIVRTYECAADRAARRQLRSSARAVVGQPHHCGAMLARARTLAQRECLRIVCRAGAPSIVLYRDLLLVTKDASGIQRSLDIGDPRTDRTVVVFRWFDLAAVTLPPPQNPDDLIVRDRNNIDCHFSLSPGFRALIIDTWKRVHGLPVDGDGDEAAGDASGGDEASGDGADDNGAEGDDADADADKKK